MNLQERDEGNYIRGNRAAYWRILLHVLGELRERETDTDVEKLQRELGHAEAHLEAVRMKLRDACDHYGDNDWPDELHLADALEKHLMRHIESHLDPLNSIEDPQDNMSDPIRTMRIIECNMKTESAKVALTITGSIDQGMQRRQELRKMSEQRGGEIQFILQWIVDGHWLNVGG